MCRHLIIISLNVHKPYSLGLTSVSAVTWPRHATFDELLRQHKKAGQCKHVNASTCFTAWPGWDLHFPGVSGQRRVFQVSVEVLLWQRQTRWGRSHLLIANKGSNSLSSNTFRRDPIVSPVQFERASAAVGTCVVSALAPYEWPH